METSSKNVWAQLSPERGLVASACPGQARRCLQHDPQPSAVLPAEAQPQRASVGGPFLQGARCPGGPARRRGGVYMCMQGGEVVCTCVYYVSGLLWVGLLCT